MVSSIGDIHGDLNRLKLVLKSCQIIDQQEKWVYGQNELVFIGDLTDRGNKGLEVINFVRKLQKEASNSGGKVTCLLGNHDAMMVAMVNWLANKSCNQNIEWLFEINGGWMDEAFTIEKTPEILEWLTNLPAQYITNSTLFQHADSFKFYLGHGNNVEEINESITSLMNTEEGPFEVFASMTDSRYWDSQSTEERLLEVLQLYLDKFNVKEVVHGHTRHEENFPVIYANNKITNIDGSLSYAYRTDDDRGFIYTIGA